MAFMAGRAWMTFATEIYRFIVPSQNILASDRRPPTNAYQSGPCGSDGLVFTTSQRKSSSACSRIMWYQAR